MFKFKYNPDQQALIKRTIDDWYAGARAAERGDGYMIGRLMGLLEGALQRLDPSDAEVYIESLQEQTDWHREDLVNRRLAELAEAA